MTRKVLLHISGNRFPPLPEVHTDLQTWRQLAQGFDEYHMFARGYSNRFRATRSGNIHLHQIPAFGSRMWVFFFSSWLVLYYALRIKPTHILAQCPVLGGPAAVCAARLLGVPSMVELHGEWYFRRGGASRVAFAAVHAVAKFSFWATTRVRALSSSMIRAMSSTYGHSAKKATIIPVRVNLAVFSPPKEDYSIRSRVKIISVGSFVPNKNHLALMRVLAASGLDFELSLCGRGPLEAEYRAEAARLGIEDRLNIHVSLPHDKLAPVLRDSDIYIHYSLSEAMPRAVLEAMSVGLPVLATRVGFLDGVVTNGSNGMLLDQPYEEDLTRYLKDLVGSVEKRSSCGVTARKTVETEFEAESVFSRYRSAILDMPRMQLEGK